MYTKKSALAAAFMSLFGISEVASAESDAPGASDSSAVRMIEEIVVVAQRREQSLQDVPIAITALDANSLDKLGISNSMDLRMTTPGLNFTTRGGGASLASIRGVSTPNTAPGSEASVAVYVDGVYIPTAAAGVFNLGNIDRVEVLKGPQGTLFGRNATGGLIHVITKKPTAETEGFASLAYGRFGTSTGKFYASGGSEDLAASISFHGNRQDDGWGKNITTGQDAYTNEEFGVRTAVVWTPREDSEFYLSADWVRKDGDLGRIYQAYPGSYLLDRTTNLGSYITNQNYDANTRKDDHWGVSLKYSQDFDWGTFSSLTAYRNLAVSRTFDSDGSSLGIADATANESTESIQQEFLFVGEAGKLNWTAGAFFLQIDTGFDPLQIRSILPTTNVDIWGLQETFSYSGFVEGAYEVTPATNVTLGVRYTVDEKDQGDSRVEAAPGFPFPVGTVVARSNKEITLEDPTWRLVVDHQLTEQHMLYASYSRGFKSGAFNAANITQAPVESETLDAYEVGIKSDFMDNQLRASLSAFFYDYQDIQSFITTGSGSTTAFNAANAEITGMDAELLYFTTLGRGDLDFRAGVSILDSEYKEFPSGVATIPKLPSVGGNTIVGRDLSGNSLVNTPDYTVNLGFDYSLPVAEGTFGLSANYYYNDGFYWEVDNRIQQESYGVLNSKINYLFGGSGDQYEVWAKGNNLTDERYFALGLSAADGDRIFYAEPRTWEVGIKMNF